MQKNGPKFNQNNQGVWEYKTIDGDTYCYTERNWDYAENRKVVTPWTFQNGKWVKKLFPVHNRLFNLHLLKLFPEKPILIVEGEKAATAGMSLFTDFNVMTWLGGTSAVNKVDFSPFDNRIVYILPDNDTVGYEAAEKIKDILLPNVCRLYLVNIASLGVRPKWDLADLDEGEVDFIDVYNLVIGSPQVIFDPDELTAYDFPDVSKKGNVLNTTDNIDFLLNHFKIKSRYNLMTNYPEFNFPGKSFSKANEGVCFFTEISNLCVKNSVPKTDLENHILVISDRNRYHPAIDFVESQPWDGISRIDELLKTVVADNQKLADKLIYHWLIGCIACLYEKNGVSLEGALIFQGKQKIGKTYWFTKLLPESYRFLAKNGQMLDAKNKDDVIRVTQSWMCELAEFEGTIRKSDVEALKAFITLSSDDYRMPYGRHNRTVHRRTSFFGSVNSVQYLSDDTGNRRYWTVAAKSINYNHNIDMQQVWAELKIRYDSGDTYRLPDDIQDELNRENESFIAVDPLEELIIKSFRWEEETRYRVMSASEVMEMIGFQTTDYSSLKIAKKCGAILSKLTGKKSRKSNGKMVFDLPSSKKNIQEWG